MSVALPHAVGGTKLSIGIDRNNVTAAKLALHKVEMLYSHSPRSRSQTALEREFCRPPDQALLAIVQSSRQDPSSGCR